MNEDEIRKYVREHYGEVATGDRAHIPMREAESADCCAPQEAASC